MQNFINIISPILHDDLEKINEPFYFLVLFEGFATFTINGNSYSCNGKNLLFLTPYQILEWKKNDLQSLTYLKFHGDFYCIEYHKKEVACNGILFNNIFTKPFITLSDILFEEITDLFQKIKVLESATESFNQSIVKSYLQLILALSSREKQISEKLLETEIQTLDTISNFKNVLEKHFVKEKSVAFYAQYFNLSVDAFSKKIKKNFSKTPSLLIQERMLLEAKKKLHLTYKTIKEIAHELGFEDEFYFSRYFKKQVGVSPKNFREKVGISIVAK